MKRLLAIGIFLVLIISMAKGQVETKYFPQQNAKSSLKVSRVPIKSTPIISMPKFDIAAIQNEDKELADMDIPYRFGHGFDVSYTLTDGVWHNVEGGSLWSLTIKSEDALSLNFIFKDFYLPDGAELYIVNSSNTMVYGPVTSRAIKNGNHFMTDILSGDQVTLSLFEPVDHEGESALTIKRVVHGYRGINEKFGRIGASHRCNVDVACHPEYSEETDAVGLVLLASGTEHCSGSLLLTTDLLYKPYFLTAFHCIDSDDDGFLTDDEITNAENWMFKFFFRKETCNDTIALPGITYNSATLRAAWYGSDFALLEIGADLKENQSLYWLGWDNSGITPTSGACIHHPAGDVMKISIEDDAFFGSPGFWHVNFDEGITEGGSSGSPIFNQDHRVVGQLQGGSHAGDTCSWTRKNFDL